MLAAALIGGLSACGGVPNDATVSVIAWTPDGRRVTVWLIAPDGRGMIRTGGGTRLRGDPPRRIVTRRLSVGAEGYREIRAILRSAERYRERPIPCDSTEPGRSFITLSYERREERDYRIGINHGCASDVARELRESIARGEARIREWTASAPEEDVLDENEARNRE